MLARLFVADLKMIVRNKQSLFWAILFPIIFATVFGLFRFDDIGEAEVAVFGPTETRASIEAAVAEQPKLELVHDYETIAEARAALADDELSFALVSDGSGPVELLFNEATADRNSVFIPLVERAFSEPTTRLERVGVAGISVQYYDFVLPGLVGMAVMTYGIIGLAGMVAQYRGQRILKRIRATPLAPSMFIAGIVLAHLVLALVQSAIVMAWGTLVFGGNIRGSIAAIFFIVLLGNLTFLNIGFMVASRVESTEAASGFGNAIAMPMMFFSGVFFPTAGLPWILPQLTSILPLSPMIEAIRDISITGAAITEHLGELAQLAGWAVVTFLVASRVFRFERA